MSAEIEPTRCWICERPMVNGECEKCGPPMPYGPTVEEEREMVKAARRELRGL